MHGLFWLSTLTVTAVYSVSVPFGIAATDSAKALNDIISGAGCQDDFPSCPEWASEGECNANPDFMLTRCKHSCGQCGKIPTSDSRSYAEYSLYALRNGLTMLNCATGADEDDISSARLKLTEAVDEIVQSAPRLNQPGYITSLVQRAVQSLTSPEFKRIVTASAGGCDSAALEDISSDLPVPKPLPSSAIVTLNDGKQMPILGFGTWYLSREETTEAVQTALRQGFRHIDTAQAYGNEKEVGDAIRLSGVPRGDIFLATKLSDSADFGREKVRARVTAQLALLQTDYVDLYMLHSPHQDGKVQAETWDELVKMRSEGLTRSLGVSNFDEWHMNRLLQSTAVKPVVVQNKYSLFHPGLQSNDHGVDFVKWLADRNILLVGYSPLNPWPFKLPLLTDAHVSAVAQRLSQTPAQVLVRTGLQHGVAMLVRSANSDHIQELSPQALDFPLSVVDFSVLRGLTSLSETPWNRATGVNLFNVYKSAARAAENIAPEL